MPKQTITQRTQLIIRADGSEITVRRMKWRAARDFLSALAGHIGKYRNELDKLIDRLPEIILSVEDLARQLVTESTDLAADKFEDLDLVELGTIISAAVELNLGEELKNSLAGIRERLAALSGADEAPTRSGAASMPIS